MNSDTPNVTSVPEAAKEKGVTKQAVYQALDRGTLTEYRTGTTRLVVVDEAFQQWLSRPPQPTRIPDDDTE